MQCLSFSKRITCTVVYRNIAILQYQLHLHETQSTPPNEKSKIVRDRFNTQHFIIDSNPILTKYYNQV